MTCIIVRQGARQDYERLLAAFGHRVPVVWDRHSARKRPHAHADTAPSARHPYRRRKPPLTWTALGFVVVERPATWARAALSAQLRVTTRLWDVRNIVALLEANEFREAAAVEGVRPEPRPVVS